MCLPYRPHPVWIRPRRETMRDLMIPCAMTVRTARAAGSHPFKSRYHSHQVLTLMELYTCIWLWQYTQSCLCKHITASPRFLHLRNFANRNWLLYPCSQEKVHSSHNVVRNVYNTTKYCLLSHPFENPVLINSLFSECIIVIPQLSTHRR